MDQLPTSTPVNSATTPLTKRPEFLIEMYKQMMADINRHIIVVWQSIGVVVGAFALMGLVEKHVINQTTAATLLIAVCSWSLALLIDASYWYNRNLCIVANIERLFLTADDLKHVHYYFGSHRPRNKMITTIMIQVKFVATIAVLVIVFHLYDLVDPLPTSWWPQMSLATSLFPEIFASVAAWQLWNLQKRRNADYAEFINNSPGSIVDITGIQFGTGHGFKGGG